ncbi:MAG: hypothetical protein NVSMB27_00160 [Ktedonobacteraceae bacterium]
MPDLVDMLGIRLQLLLGSPDVPLPAPYEVVDSLVSLTVTNNDRRRDAFQMVFNLGKDSLLEYGLLRSGVLDVRNRMIIMMIFGALPQVLIDGIITKHQVVPSNEPGRSQLHVTGEDISVKLSFEDRNVTYPQQKDSDIVQKILVNAGFIPQVTQTNDTPSDTERIPTQQCNDLKYIQRLARRNGFVFFVEPTNIPGFNNAYWGPENRQGQSQPALLLNMGAQTNVDTPINFQFDALEPSEAEVSIINPLTKLAIQLPSLSSFLPSLVRSPTTPLRKTFSRDTANLSFAQALLRLFTSSSQTSDVIQATGEVDAVRYGLALRARRLVDVGGAGQSYDGTYYVKQVVHQIQRLPTGTYKQHFTLTRDGRGASGTSIVPGMT